MRLCKSDSRLGETLAIEQLRPFLQHVDAIPAIA
jgi:hypothetical protein